MDICGSDAIFIPVSECDDCAALLERIRNTYTKSEVDQLLSDLEHVRMHVVNALPATGEDNVIYLVPRAGGGYEMWVWADNQWIDLGAEEIDLSDYVEKTQLNTSTNDGLVVKSNGDTEKVWNTGTNGTPAWREDYTRKILGDFATIEGDTASKAYNIGDFLVKDGLLYKVIAAISAGNALTVGGNIARTDVGRELRGWAPGDRYTLSFIYCASRIDSMKNASWVTIPTPKIKPPDVNANASIGGAAVRLSASQFDASASLLEARWDSNVLLLRLSHTPFPSYSVCTTSISGLVVDFT